MSGASFFSHKGKQILYNDVSGNKDIEDSIAIFEKIEEIAKMQPEKSILLLTNVTNTHYNIEGTSGLKKMSKAITPYIKASAVVGVSGIKRIVWQSINKMTGRKIHLCNTLEEAKDWLVEQSND